MCLQLHTVVLSGHGVCCQLALPPSTRVLVLDNVMREPRSLALATMVRRHGARWWCSSGVAGLLPA